MMKNTAKRGWGYLLPLAAGAVYMAVYRLRLAAYVSRNFVAWPSVLVYPAVLLLYFSLGALLASFIKPPGRGMARGTKRLIFAFTALLSAVPVLLIIGLAASKLSFGMYNTLSVLTRTPVLYILMGLFFETARGMAFETK